MSCVSNYCVELCPLYIQTIDVSTVSNIDELDSEDDVSQLSVKQLKTILLKNCINYKGCVEKDELVTKVKTLWRAREAEKSE